MLFAAAPPSDPALRVSGAEQGRCAVAARALEPGDVALRSPALAAVLHEEYRGRRCDLCFASPAQDPAAKKPLSRCGGCKTAFYCGRACQQVDWKLQHKAECSAQDALVGGLEASGIHGPDALKDAILASRCVRSSASDAPPSGTAPSGSGRLADLESMEGFMTGDERRQFESIARAVVAADSACSGSARLLPAGSSTRDVFAALSRFRNNNFAVVDDLFMAVGAGCFPNGAALNHSCRPNCLLTYEFQPGQPPAQVVRAMERIPKGAELCHSYVDLALPAWERRDTLREVYGFSCACAGCAQGGGAAAEGAETGRGPGDLLLVADVEGRAACPSPGAACPLATAPACKRRDQELEVAGQLARRAAAEEDAERELKLWEEVCRVRERWLHPRHTDVVAAHAAGHTAAMAAGSWGDAERHCQRLVEHYLAVYPPWHPITGLQMFTLGELKEQAGACEESRKWYAKAKSIMALTHGKTHSLVLDLEGRLE